MDEKSQQLIAQFRSLSVDHQNEVISQLRAHEKNETASVGWEELDAYTWKRLFEPKTWALIKNSKQKDSTPSVIPTTGNDPSMLLYDLPQHPQGGRCKSTREFEDWLRNRQPGTPNFRIMAAPSGSGKTRTVLEALCRYYGVFIWLTGESLHSFQQDTDVFEEQLRGVSGKGDAYVTCQLRFAQLVLNRLHFLHHLVCNTEETPSPYQWMLLQYQLQTDVNAADKSKGIVGQMLAKKLRQLHRTQQQREEVEAKIKDTWEVLKKKLSKPKGAFFLLSVDEAQLLVGYKGFLSPSSNMARYALSPILSMIAKWEFCRVSVSGTSLRLRDALQCLTSAIGKPKDEQSSLSEADVLFTHFHRYESFEEMINKYLTTPKFKIMVEQSKALAECDMERFCGTPCLLVVAVCTIFTLLIPTGRPRFVASFMQMILYVLRERKKDSASLDMKDLTAEDFKAAANRAYEDRVSEVAKKIQDVLDGHRNPVSGDSNVIMPMVAMIKQVLIGGASMSFSLIDADFDAIDKHIAYLERIGDNLTVRVTEPIVIAAMIMAIKKCNVDYLNNGFWRDFVQPYMEASSRGFLVEKWIPVALETLKERVVAEWPFWEGLKQLPAWASSYRIGSSENIVGTKSEKEFLDGSSNDKYVFPATSTGPDLLFALHHKDNNSQGLRRLGLLQSKVRHVSSIYPSSLLTCRLLCLKLLSQNLSGHERDHAFDTVKWNHLSDSSVLTKILVGGTRIASIDGIIPENGIRKSAELVLKQCAEIRSS